VQIKLSDTEIMLISYKSLVIFIACHIFIYCYSVFIFIKIVIITAEHRNSRHYMRLVEMLSCCQ